MKAMLTRRQWSAAVIGSTPLLAQTAAPKPQGPGEELRAAKEQQDRNAQELTKFQVSMATEPAFQFKA